MNGGEDGSRGLGELPYLLSTQRPPYTCLRNTSLIGTNHQHCFNNRLIDFFGIGSSLRLAFLLLTD
jgi:hypothetical protein